MAESKPEEKPESEESEFITIKIKKETLESHKFNIAVIKNSFKDLDTIDLDLYFKFLDILFLFSLDKIEEVLKQIGIVNSSPLSKDLIQRNNQLYI